MNEVRVVRLEPGRDKSVLKSSTIMILSKFSAELIPSNSPILSANAVWDATLE